MKNKKYNYIIVLVLMLTLGITKIYANTDCYYMSSDQETLISYNTKKGKFVIEQRGKMSIDTAKTEPLINDGFYFDDGETGIRIMAIPEGTCPEHIVYRRKNGVFKSDGIFGFNNKSEATTFYTNSSQIDKMYVWMLSYKNTDGTTITSETFYEQERENIGSTSGGNYGNVSGTEVNGDKVNVDCETIFGSKDDPNSLRYLIDEILMYPKILVPIILILLGMLDFGKAVIASKEDQMKKAQETFVKRIIAAVAIFFIPVLVDLLMELADIVWAGTGYSSCGL